MMSHLPFALAESDPDYFGLILWTLLIVAFSFGMFWVIKRTREYLRQGTSDDPTARPGGFTLADLRQLQRDGKITPEEFERAKFKVLEAIKSAEPAAPPQHRSAGAGP